MTASFPNVRLRRLRQHPALRDLVCETRLHPKDLILPIFVKGLTGEKVLVSSMPGHYQIPVSRLKEEIEEILPLNLGGIMLFGVPPHKDEIGSDSFNDQGIVQRALREIKSFAPHLLVMTDICFCEYTLDGHCGIIKDRNGYVDLQNDETLELLAKQAVSHVQAGSDVLSPSGMADGAVQTIRKAIDEAGFSHIPILSHSIKYASSLYGPFRAATEGAPKWGDRRTYQADPSNALEALREVQHDIQEGVDIVMVKPAHAYLDVIYRVKEAYPSVPLAAYHTSGEFGFIKAAAEKGWIDERKGVYEILTAIRRAGADFIITYYAKEFAYWYQEK